MRASLITQEAHSEALGRLQAEQRHTASMVESVAQTHAASLGAQGARQQELTDEFAVLHRKVAGLEYTFGTLSTIMPTLATSGDTSLPPRPRIPLDGPCPQETEGMKIMERLRLRPRDNNAPTNPISVTPFSGAEDVMSWLDTWEKVIAGKGLSTSAEQMRWICTNLTGAAFIFFSEFEDVPTWETFKERFIAEYAKRGNAIALRRELVALRQKGTQIDLYISAFKKITAALKVAESPVGESEALTWFCEGLQDDVRLHIYSNNPPNVEECMKMARVWQLAHDKNTFSGMKGQEIQLTYGNTPMELGRRNSAYVAFAHDAARQLPPPDRLVDAALARASPKSTAPAEEIFGSTLLTPKRLMTPKKSLRMKNLPEAKKRLKKI